MIDYQKLDRMSATGLDELNAARARAAALAHADPDDRCFACQGTGVLLWPSGHRECWVCDGAATAGVFVVRLVVGRAEFELGGGTPDYHRAVAAAGRAARLAARVYRRGRPTEARVVYLGVADDPQKAGTVVHRAAVGRGVAAG